MAANIVTLLSGKDNRNGISPWRQSVFLKPGLVEPRGCGSRCVQRYVVGGATWLLRRKSGLRQV
jgi:hypothetical protein